MTVFATCFCLLTPTIASATADRKWESILMLSICSFCGQMSQVSLVKMTSEQAVLQLAQPLMFWFSPSWLISSRLSSFYSTPVKMGLFIYVVLHTHLI